MDLGKGIASRLLEIGAVKIQPDDPFSWASGWKSPIYCDNRKTLSFPHVRDYIKEAFAERIKELYPKAEVIAGVATGAIAIGALVADILELPFIYIRSKAKGHGMENLIEGDVQPGKKVVIIEDLVSTGGSSLKAFEALKDADYEVLGMLAIFTYGFPVSKENFEHAGCKLETLSNYECLIEFALEEGYVSEAQLNTLMQWRVAPATWGK